MKPRDVVPLEILQATIDFYLGVVERATQMEGIGLVPSIIPRVWILAVVVAIIVQGRDEIGSLSVSDEPLIVSTQVQDASSTSPSLLPCLLCCRRWHDVGHRERKVTLRP